MIVNRFFSSFPFSEEDSFSTGEVLKFRDADASEKTRGLVSLMSTDVLCVRLAPRLMSCQRKNGVGCRRISRKFHRAV